MFAVAGKKDADAKIITTETLANKVQKSELMI
jgi:hypothetical protein